MTSVMVVDDDQDLAEMLGIVLNGVGIEVDLVSSCLLYTSDAADE